MTKNRVKTSVIVAVYNHFNWLKLILDALEQQTCKDFEIVIADDGSSAETVALINNYIDAHREMRIVHSWIEDKGWRKNISLNEAVRRASGDYLIFVDGDCIPHRKFVADHLRLRRHGVVLGGRRLDLSPRISAEVETWSDLPKNPFDTIVKRVICNVPRQSFGCSLRQLRRAMRFGFPFGKAVMVKNGGFLGCNFSIYREDLEKVNGFDERYLDPGTGEDTDLDARLQNAGIKHLRFSHYALMLHRNHKRLVFDSPRNEALYKAAREEGVTYVETGLHQDSNQ